MAAPVVDAAPVLSSALLGFAASGFVGGDATRADGRFIG
jgi:hypothetical protein